VYTETNGIISRRKGWENNNRIFLCTGGIPDELFGDFQDLRYNNQIQVNFLPLLTWGASIIK
jgi:hypothetical protein